MSSIFPLLLSIALYTSLVKLAAFLYKRALLSWRDACIFSLILLMVLGAGTLLNRLSGNAIPLLVSIAAGMVIQVGIGAWYLAPRARDAGGELLGSKGAAMLSLIAYGLIAALGLLAAMAMGALVD
ncbi:hypothetical protein [Rugamonas aquatica]|uniref:Uncharacterized protein n=1 Tax=Rugamonas aquatica TaxID=2743357 RepID=A0A6A7N570_9BURK|nr:hypothetical protein [Rugamonas aquatica]MQA40166.1 hypothetical protein [Rugamonas aquatica]